jgi:hypothetical protein
MLNTGIWYGSAPSGAGNCTTDWSAVTNWSDMWPGS